MHSKYIASLSVEDWIRMPIEPTSKASIIWKALVLAFPIVGNRLCWKAGNWRSIKLSIDPWVGCDGQHKLFEDLIEHLRQQDIITLADVAIPGQVNYGTHE
jgi:hypothetical protein